MLTCVLSYSLSMAQTLMWLQYHGCCFSLKLSFPIFHSYHTGTLAFGAFIIALIQIIRIGLEYLDSKLKGADNEIAKFFLKCLKCCFYCLEKFMKMINKNAYIMVSYLSRNGQQLKKQSIFHLSLYTIRSLLYKHICLFVQSVL